MQKKPLFTALYRCCVVILMHRSLEEKKTRPSIYLNSFLLLGLLHKTVSIIVGVLHFFLLL